MGAAIPFTATARNEIAGTEKIGAIAKGKNIIRIKDSKGIMKNLEGVYFAEPEFFDILQIN